MLVPSQRRIPNLSTPGDRRGQTPLRDARQAHEGGQSPPRRWLARLVRERSIVLAAIAVAALVFGGALHLAGYPTAGTAIWGAAVAVLSAELLVEVVWTVAVKHHMGVDMVALVAMIGALVLDQELAGLIVGLMYSGGATLEELASARARRDLTALVERAPKVARVRLGDDYRIVAVDEVAVGDIVSVRAGEVVPVDGTLASDEAVLDTSTLTGEPLPVTVSQGMKVLSGTANAGPPMEVRTERPASESAYAALVRLVDRAQGQRAPFVRMADRYAGIFLPVTLAVALGAWLAEWRSGASSGGRRRRDTLSFDTGGTDCVHLGTVPRSAVGSDRQGLGSNRNTWACAHGAVRQDRDLDRRVAGAKGGDPAGRGQPGGAPSTGRIGGSALGARPRRDAGAVEIVRRLRAEGVSLLGIVSGDRRSVAERIGRELGIDRVYAELTPRDKLEVVRSIRARPELRPVIMVGTA